MLAFFDKRYWRFLMFITLGMLSNELVASVPLILLFISIFEKTKLKIKYLFAGLIVATLFLLLRFVWFPTSLGSEYLLSFSPLVWLKNLKWYVFRAFGLAEGFRGHIDMWQIQVSLIALVGVALAFARRLRISSIFLLGIGWFIVAIMPVMLLSHHQSPIYQIIGLPGMIIALLSLLPKKLVLNWKVAGVMFLYFVSSLLSVRAMQEYHWVTKRARLARYHLNKLKMHRVEQDSVVSFINSTPKSSTHVYFSLGGENGVKVFFDKSVKALFEDFDSVSLSPETIYIFSHKEI